MPTDLQQQLAAESLYRDANTLLYADNKPSEEAIDRVVAKMNKECAHPPCQPLCYVLTLRNTASTKRSDSPGSGPTKIRATLHTSTNATGCSTRRCAHLRTRLPGCSSSPMFSLIDCAVLRQVHGRDPCELRARHCTIVMSLTAQRTILLSRTQLLDIALYLM